ncbi:MAG: hypothetical protein GY810_10380, partial [Aureispira sp.]|nr:hypothetical protein [Aureispira sp.]
QLSIAQYSKPIPNPTDAKATSPKWELTAFSKYVTSYSYYGRFPELDILTVGKYNFIRLFGKWGTTAGEGRYEILFQANFNNHFIPRFEYHTYEKTLIGTSCDESSQSKTTMSIDHKNNQFTLTTTGTKLFFDREGPTKRIDASDAKVYKVVVRHKVERID